VARFLPIRVVLPLALLAGLGQAQNRQVCLDDQAALKKPALGSFYREFQSLVGPRGVELAESGCQPDAIRLSLYERGDGREADVLGAARVEGSRIAPTLEIYLDRVVALLPESNCWNTVGRALARVAAHEVAHFLDQDQRHAESGLLRSRFTGMQLASDDSYPFRWIPAER
jgi:hypothetical protein